MPKVSVIVGAYNIEDYISRCLDSISNQTFQDIEIIVVNDGSTDNTLNKIKERAENDFRYKIIDKKNQGLIEARKSGLKEAEGEYILFVDGDDFIDKDTIKILYHQAEVEDYDIVCYKYLRTDALEIKKGSGKCKALKEYEFLSLCLTGVINHEIVTKFIKRSFILRSEILLPCNISYGEDLAFTCSLAIHKPKACTLDEYLYHYVHRDCSLTNKISPHLLEITEVINFIEKELSKNNLLIKYREEFEYLSYNESYIGKIDVIFKTNNVISRKLYKNWKRMNIKIYKNRFYKELYKNDSIKSKMISRLCESSYILGRLYHSTKKILVSLGLET